MTLNSKILTLKFNKQTKNKQTHKTQKNKTNNQTNKTPAFSCFAKPSTPYIFDTNQPIFMAFQAKCGIKIGTYN